jgi:branched-chain amino acid transport system ATP-binding protein
MSDTSDTSDTNDTSDWLLEVAGLETIYDHAILALRGIDLRVREGQIVALLGANGAGKSTTLKAISNLLRAESGEVRRGEIRYRGRPITHADPADLVQAGLVQVLEGRHCFPHLTVEENLRMGAASRRVSRSELEADLEGIYGLFPRLRERRRISAGHTSGGEQQMVAIGRALMAKPSLVLLDEPSMGLAPQVVEEIFETVKALNRERGVSFLLAEQNAALALQFSDYAYIVENGRVASHGAAASLREQDSIEALYLGGESGSERTSSSRARRAEFRFSR